MRFVNKFAILFSLIFLTYSITYAQEEEIEEEIIEEEIVDEDLSSAVPDTINLVDFYNLLVYDESETTISDYVIITNNKDKDLKINKVFFSLYELKPENANHKKLNIYNCKFVLDQKSPLYINDWLFSRLNIVGCDFYTEIHFNNIKEENKYELLLENCNFKNHIYFGGEEESAISLKIRKCNFNTKLSFETDISDLFLERNKFVYDSIKFAKGDTESTDYQLNCSEINIDNLNISRNIFNSNNIDLIFSVNLGSSSIGQLQMTSDSMESINLTNAEVEKSFLVDSLFISKYIGILNLDFPEKNTNASWVNLGGEKFAVFNEDFSGMVIPYQAKTDEQLSKLLYFNDLMSAYNKFNTLYLDRGDRNSANASYVEIKDIETRHQAYIQKVDPNLNNLINYKLNEFLKTFSDYATNPGKSLIQSIYVLLFFTFIYMFSFSLWDGMNYRYYLNQFNIFPSTLFLTKQLTK